MTPSQTFQVPSDETFLRTIANRIRTHAKESSGHVFLETAGGGLWFTLSFY